MQQRTLAIIKPDVVSLAKTGALIQKIEDTKLSIVGMKRVQWSLEDVALFYQEHIEKPYYEALSSFMRASPLVLLALEGEEAILFWRQFMGATDPKKAEKNSIRFDFGFKKMPANAVHGSDSESAAKRELELCFKPFELQSALNSKDFQL